MFNRLCGYPIGLDQPFFLIAGPCVIESEQFSIDTAGQIKAICSELKIPLIYKSSYDKANRSSGSSFRGLGMDKGLAILEKVKKQIGVPVLTDVHDITDITSVAAVESGFRPDAVSPKGAIGVMQLMPETAKTLAVDPHDTAQNIEAGARLLRELLIKYNGDVVKALSAYNAGAGAVDRYKGMPPYAETQEYVYKVVKTYLKNGGK